ncbi:g2927 [Coccomyxa viridis]|uniref:G2927 protein n=1 Tax=Coccomyxa viridis TaxID=1274662 RepID=A0ABP1FRS1_9CHLO
MVKGGGLLQGCATLHLQNGYSVSARESRVFSISRESNDRFPGTALASEFSQHINQSGTKRPLEHRGPTPMLPPTAVVAAQMDALQMNDWPDSDSGIRTAFLFSKPYECESMIAGRASPTECHSWQGKEQWIAYKEFADALRSPPLDVLLNCESWQACSQLLFPSQRKENRAVQAVEVRAPTGNRQHPYTFTFCLERIDVGPYKGCWMTVGLRMGDYSR